MSLPLRLCFNIASSLKSVPTLLLICDHVQSELDNLHFLICEIIRNKCPSSAFRTELLQKFDNHLLHCCLLLNGTTYSVLEYSTESRQLITLNPEELYSNRKLLLGFCPFYGSSNIDNSEKKLLCKLAELGQLIMLFYHKEQR